MDEGWWAVMWSDARRALLLTADLLLWWWETANSM
jgi:hypothetical protein